MAKRLTDTAKWETSPFGPSNRSGVYAVMCGNFITKKSTVLYIGSSKNMYKRVNQPSHPYRKLSSETISDDHFIYVKFKECDNYIELEKRIIKKLKPPFNLQHTGIEFRSYKISLNG